VKKLVAKIILNKTKARIIRLKWINFSISWPLV
jgi:hypothetical protein